MESRVCRGLSDTGAGGVLLPAASQRRPRTVSSPDRRSMRGTRRCHSETNGCGFTWSRAARSLQTNSISPARAAHDSARIRCRLRADLRCSARAVRCPVSSPQRVMSLPVTARDSLCILCQPVGDVLLTHGWITLNGDAIPPPITGRCVKRARHASRNSYVNVNATSTSADTRYDA